MYPFVDSQRNKGNWKTNTKKNQLKFKKKRNFTGFHPGQFGQNFEFWLKLRNQSVWVFQIGVWKARLRDEAPQTDFSQMKLNFSKCLILQFHSKFEMLFKLSLRVKPGKGTILFGFQLILLCENVIRRLVFKLSLFRWDSTKSEIRDFDEFSIQNYAVFHLTRNQLILVGLRNTEIWKCKATLQLSVFVG